MSSCVSSAPPDPAAASTSGEFVAALNELRVWAGQPSLRQLQQLGGKTVAVSGDEVDALPASSISYVLRGRGLPRLPRMGFVAAYVSACMRAGGWRAGDIEGQVERWRWAWRSLAHRHHADAVSAGETAPGWVVPAQLPADLATFTGRAAELSDLLASLPGDEQAPAAVVISAIDGMAGVGKTALAVHAAHRLAERFPDGQLFVDLHGFAQGVNPVDPGDALDRMLRALGVPGEQIPHRLDDRAGLFRTRLADKRMLVLLDNAATESQVVPLLPGAPGCLVLVTSRGRLAGLDDVRPLSVDILPVDDALALFTSIVGEARLAREPRGLVAEIVELCGRLPLAIRIAAARLRARPGWTLAHLAERLRDQQHRLGELEAGQRGVAAAIDLSYRHLATDQQRVYRLLGLHPGADVDTYAAAALVDVTALGAGRLLDDLVDASLLQEPTPGRFRFHDLIRAHAAHTAAREEVELGRRAALTRLFDHYVHTAAVAMDALYPHEVDQRPRPPQPHTPTPGLDDQHRATAWLDAELANLLAAAAHAAEDDWPTHSVYLSATLSRHLQTRAYYSDAHTLHTHALTAARATGDRAGQLSALNGLGHLHYMQGRYRPATEYFEQALEIARAARHRVAELITLTGLGIIHFMQGRHGPAADCFGPALEIARETGDRVGELNALRCLGHVHFMRGRYRPAADHLGKALDIAREIGDRTGQLNALRGLGHLHFMRGRNGPAADCFGRALEIAHATGNRNGQFEALYGLGHTYRVAGHPDHALTHHRAALDLTRELQQRPDEARALDGLARAYHILGQCEEARRHWQQALDILHDLGLAQAEDVSAVDIRAHLNGLNRGQREPT